MGHKPIDLAYPGTLLKLPAIRWAGEKLDEGKTALTPALSPAERVINRRTSVGISLTVARVPSSNCKNNVNMGTYGPDPEPKPLEI